MNEAAVIASARKLRSLWASIAGNQRVASLLTAVGG